MASWPVTSPIESFLDLSARHAAITERSRVLIPGVIDPTLVSAIPGAAPLAAVELETKSALPIEGNGWNLVTGRMHVDAAFFETFEARLLGGRGFTGDEFSAPSRSIVVSQRLLGGVLKRALWQILAGAAVGVAVAIFVDHELPAGSSGGIDIPGVLPIAALFMILVALLATLGPARRALRLDPNEALRDGG